MRPESIEHWAKQDLDNTHDDIQREFAKYILDLERRLGIAREEVRRFRGALLNIKILDCTCADPLWPIGDHGNNCAKRISATALAQIGGRVMSENDTTEMGPILGAAFAVLKSKCETLHDDLKTSEEKNTRYREALEKMSKMYGMGNEQTRAIARQVLKETDDE